MSKSVHRDPLSAWKFLCIHGGIDIEGRDEGMALRIHGELNPDAPSLDLALANATMEAFAKAFFEAAHPFVTMFRDILKFFEDADATRGQNQWTLQVDGANLNLDHFRQWLGAWRKAGKVNEEVTAIDFEGSLKLLRVFLRRDPVQVELQKSYGNATVDLPADVRVWIASYDRGEYLSLPGSLKSSRCPIELRKTVMIVQMVILRLLGLKLTRDKVLALYHRPGDRYDESDAFEFKSIAQNETDRWLRSMVVAISSISKQSTPSELTAIGAELDAITNQYPLRPFEVAVSIDDLESVLSLPVWKKRSELYAVWIATEIVRALEGHKVELHHENGRIAFAFRETLLATVHSSPGPFTLVSECYSPLENPRGKGRKAGVQPDYILWTVAQEIGVCRMVVEVKDHKKSAKREFSDSPLLRMWWRQALRYTGYHRHLALEARRDASNIRRSSCGVLMILTPAELKLLTRKKHRDAQMRVLVHLRIL